MAYNRNFNPSQDEAQTYTHLGVIAANAGHGASVYATRQQVANGDRDPILDMRAWFAQQGFDDEELEELYRFRNSLLHGMVTVQSDGTVDIWDKLNGHQTYTPNQISRYASRFYGLRLENLAPFPISVQHLCKCGVVFSTPDDSERLLEHLRDCPAKGGQSSA